MNYTPLKDKRTVSIELKDPKTKLYDLRKDILKK